MTHVVVEELHSDLAQAGLERAEVGAGRVDEEPDAGHQADLASGLAADEDIDSGQPE